MAEQEPRTLQDEGADDEQDVQGHDFMTEEVARQRVRETAREAETRRKVHVERGKARGWLDRLTGR